MKGITVNGVPIKPVSNSFKYGLNSTKEIEFRVDVVGKNGKIKTFRFKVDISKKDYDWMVKNKIIISNENKLYRKT